LLVAALLAATALSAVAVAGGNRARSSVSALPGLAIYTRSDDGRRGLFGLAADGRSAAGWIARPMAVETACPSPEGGAVALTIAGGGVRIVQRTSGAIRKLPFWASWSCAGWSADGTLLLLVSPPLSCLPSQPNAPWQACSNAARKVKVVPLHGNVLTLAFGPGRGFRSAAWAPKTHELAFVRLAHVGRDGADGTGSIELARLSGAGLRLRALGGSLHAKTVAWAPDERSLAVESSPSQAGDGSSAISILDVATGHTITLGRGRQPVWSSRGALAWVCGRALCMRGAASAPVQRIVAPAGWRPADATGFYQDPAWSPDGSELAFETSPTRDSSRIVIWSAKTKRVRTLFRAEKNDQEAVPAWAPGGRYVAFWAGLFRGQAAIYTIKPYGKVATLLSPQSHGGFAYDDGFFWWPSNR